MEVGENVWLGWGTSDPGLHAGFDVLGDLIKSVFFSPLKHFSDSGRLGGQKRQKDSDSGERSSGQSQGFREYDILIS